MFKESNREKLKEISKGDKIMCHRQIKITTYDRLLRAWENSMEAVREFSKLCRFDGGQRQSKTGFL